MELFSMDGRYNRAKYFGTLFAIWLVILVARYAVSYAIGLLGGNVLRVAGIIIELCLTVVLAFQVVKRLHDLDRPGTHFWLLLIPIYNIYLSLVILLFTKGTEGENQYGPDPLAGQ